ncbi:S-methyl-5-thioribose-1-phosphate isomerase [Candidatus Fermentibacteria bacterium]|nr:MAG: S-methyl-5-thioribose-1-phosphate isomerase [Candidatus Fermentibacteria bacterium]
MIPVPTMEWKEGRLVLLDQRELPGREIYFSCDTVEILADSIRTLAVRGAPAIGIAAAYGAVTAMKEAGEGENFREKTLELVDVLAKTRPTAVNLFNCLDIQRKIIRECNTRKEGLSELLLSAERMFSEDLKASMEMGRLGAALLPDNCTVLTHCNAGGLATAGLGTALSVIYKAFENGKLKEVYADETRPLLQGARLTSWELSKAGIPVKVIPDSAAASLIASGRIDAVITGADRIAMNGDSANKIGTLSLAVNAGRAGIPFYIVAPVTTFDSEAQTGKEIVIEERGRGELASLGDRQLLPEGVGVFNPAFDVTPVELITAIVCERGVISSPEKLLRQG